MQDLITLTMPRKGGLEVLAEIKKNADLKLVLMVLTTSAAEHDLLKTYGSHAYDVNSIDLDRFIEIRG